LQLLFFHTEAILPLWNLSKWCHKAIEVLFNLCAHHVTLTKLLSGFLAEGDEMFSK